MSEYKFTKEHEWLMVDGDVVTVGITDFAQQQLGDIVFLDLPEKDQELQAGEEVVVIESVKAAGEVHAPVAGVVVEINADLASEPETVNADPLGAGWFYRVKVAAGLSTEGFMSADEYAEYIDE